LDRLCGALEELAQYGPTKPEEWRGLSEENVPKPDWCVRVNKDQQNYRTGWLATTEEQSKNLMKTAHEKKWLVHKDRITDKHVNSIKELQDAKDYIKGAVMICFPAYHTLPDYEPVK